MTQYEGHQDQRWGHISYAQHGDDFFLINLFELLGIDKPSYLDIGAHHPTRISNTALLYKRGSRGVNVEANPNLIEAFFKDRPEDVNINMGVGLERGRMPFYMFYPDSGRNTFSEIERDIVIAEGHPVQRILVVDVVHIDYIMDQYCGGKYPNLLTIDVEGLDYDILQSADFTESQPDVICAEVRHEGQQRMKDMLAGKGYFCLCRIAANLIFVRTKHENLVR